VHGRADFRPFAFRGRRPLLAMLLTFTVVSALGVTSSIWATKRSQSRASVIEVAARQRTLTERYVKEVLLARGGVRVDPSYTASILSDSARVLLDGGTAPAVKGDDDGTDLPRAPGATLRAQFRQEARLVRDLTATGAAILHGRPAESVALTAHEQFDPMTPIRRLQVLGRLTSNAARNAARTLAAADDGKMNDLIVLQAALGVLGLLTSLRLAWALISATRRQTAHFLSLVTSSTDLVLVLGAEGCRHASASVARMVGREEAELLGRGYEALIHPEDRHAVRGAAQHGAPEEIVFRIRNGSGEWRHVEARVTDLRADRWVRGVVLNSRDVTERVKLEEELMHQAFHDALTGLPNRVLFRDRLDHALAQAVRRDHEIAVFLVDLDGFKQVNDGLGHDAGDELLRVAASRFEEVVRASDTVARFGGDEFALLLEDVVEEEAVTLARRLVGELAEPVALAGRDVALGASIGIVLSGGGASSEELVRNADVAMYAAKDAGRGRFEVFHPELAKRARFAREKQGLAALESAVA
jgi:diguanylate cyclase (GGDEF)-like protein/PAS domain S-box-containing protein